MVARPDSGQLRLRLAWVRPDPAFSLGRLAWRGGGQRRRGGWGATGDGGDSVPEWGAPRDGGAARDGSGGAVE